MQPSFSHLYLARSTKPALQSRLSPKYQLQRDDKNDGENSARELGPTSREVSNLTSSVVVRTARLRSLFHEAMFPEWTVSLSASCRTASGALSG